MNITDICIRRSVLAWMIMGATILFGLVTAMRIGVSQMPDVDSPNVTVSLSWPGAAPSEVERGLIEPLEQSLAQVEGIERIEATARLGNARLTAVFGLGRNIDLALQDVQAKVAQAQRSLPKDVQQPTISKSNPDDQPLLTIGVRGPFSRQMLADVARYQVQQKLQTIPGVGQVSTAGYLERNIRLWIDSSKLIERNVTVSDITNALNRQHVVVAGGQLQMPGRELNVQVLGEAADIATLEHIVVADRAAAPVYLRDVAMVEDGFEDARTIARVDGEPLQALSVLKQRGANAVSVAGNVRAAVDELRVTLPKGMELEVLFDTTKFIEESIHEIETELALAVVLTSIVCWLFLGSFSATVNVLLAIPMSLFGTIAVIWAAGFTLNTFTLLGLSLAIGLVVDDAVMVMENIDRHNKMGKDSFRAASEGTKEISFAALAATAAVIAIFLPVVFMDGVVGRYFLQFGVTLSVAVAISYVEAITLAPARCARLFRNAAEPGWLLRTVDRGFHRLAHGYSRVLRFALGHPWKVLAVSTAVTAGCFAIGLSLPSEFSPAQDQSRFSVRITAPTGSDLTEADRFARRAEETLYNHAEVDRVLTSVGPGSANLTVDLVPPGQRKQTQQEFAATLRKELVMPGARVSIQDPSQQGIGSSKGYPIQVSIRGPDWNTLITQALRVRDELARSGVATDVDSDYQVGLPQILIEPDRKRTADLGVSIQDLATTVNALVGGTIVGKYSSAGRRLDVRMRLLRGQRLTPEDIGNIYVRSSSGHLVPISTMVDVQEKPVLQAINHVDRERSISVYGNVAPGHYQSEALEVVKSLSSDFPVGYRAVLGGQSNEFQSALSSLLFALVFGIAVAYMILAAQFDSFLHPVTVLTILPLSIAGAFVGLWAGGKTLSIYSMIGILLLMGITKKNSIILVDYANAARAAKPIDAREAMLEAGPIRLRPILMTTAATMMAAVPAALGLGAGSETRGPMSLAVLGGLALSTLLSLLVVPAFYVVADRLKQRVARRKTAVQLAAQPVADGE
ncbi:MAG TPA: efflux RND transporter permease subunit [Polyangiaceae bacterium]|nr:efflux RND transporter permease subunit [Polyangiaceae bacterium]